MHKPESVTEDETYKILLDFKIETDHQIPTRRSDLVLIQKKKKIICPRMNFAVPADHRMKIKEIEKIDKCLHVVKEI